MTKKLVAIGLAAAVMAAGVGVMAGCGGSESSEIRVAFSRPATSGTYGAFNELVKNTDGKTIAEALKEDGGEFSRNVQMSSENGTVITDVYGNKNSLGYISLGLVEANSDKIKSVKVDGVEASVANINNGSYQLSRPFNLIYRTETGLSDLAQNFLDFIGSEEGQAIVGRDYIGLGVTVSDYAPYEGTLTKLTLWGSTSVQPLMNGEGSGSDYIPGLIAAYREKNPGITVECGGDGSGAGEKGAAAGTCDFGMISRAAGSGYSSEDGYTTVQIAIDGIAIIVNKDVALSNVTMNELYDLYINGTAIENK